MVRLVEDSLLWNGKNLNGCDRPNRGECSMARRMPIVNREELSSEHQAAYDEVAGIRGRPPEVGPSSVMIHNPEMAAQVNRLSAFLMTAFRSDILRPRTDFETIIRDSCVFY